MASNYLKNMLLAFITPNIVFFKLWSILKCADSYIHTSMYINTMIHVSQTNRYPWHTIWCEF